MQIIDAHQHFWDPRHRYYPLLHGGSRDTPRRDDVDCYLPADYLRDVNGHDVAGTVHIEGAHDPDDPVGETRWLHQQARTTGLPTAMVAYADLRSPDVAEVLDAHLSHREIRGVRQMLDIDPRGRGPLHDALDDYAWRCGLQAVAERGLCFVAQVDTAALPRLAAVVAEFQELTVVLCHAGLRGVDAVERWDQWVAGLERIAACPNAVVTVSGLAGATSRWNHALSRQVTQTVLDIAGPERVMFGSNFPVDRTMVTFGELVRVAAEASQHLAPAERAAFFAGTARRVYRLDDLLPPGTNG